jgi:hypothetical protein
MKYLAKYIVLILAVIFVQDTIAQDGDAVFNKIIKEYTLNPDGSTEYREYKEVKLLSHMSFHRLYGETFIVFDPLYQKIVINEAYTIMKDGQKVVVPDNAFNEVLPRAARNAAPYNHLRELVITHTGLEVGATIYLDYTIKTKAGYMPTFMGEEMIKDIVPIKEKKVIVRIPGDQDLHYRVLNIRTGPTISEVKGMKEYSFLFKGLSAYQHLWGTDYEALPRMFFSAAKDLERAYFPFVAQPAFTYRVNDDMVHMAEKIRKESDDDLKAILAIQKLVVNDIRTWNLPLEYAGFRCRTPEETWNSNAGTAIEKTVLLATLLMQADFSATPVGIIPSKYYDRTVGSLYMFEDFAVQVRLPSGEMIYLSATALSSQDLSISRQGKVFLILDGAIESLKTYDSKSSASSMTFSGDLMMDGGQNISGTINVRLSGNANPYFGLYQDSAYIKRYAHGVQKAEVKQIEIGESIANLEAESKAEFQEASYIILNIPESGYGIASWGFRYIETNRKSPIKFRETFTEEYLYEIQIPGDIALINPLLELDIENEVGSVSIEIRQKGAKVIVKRKFNLKKSLIAYNQFDALNEIWNAWMTPSMKKLVFSIAE